MLIYFLEDDASISYIIEKTISNAGYEVKGFSKSKDFLDEIAKRVPNLMILDIMLPDIPGLEVLKKVRENHKHIPIIMVSALSSEMDKVKALDSGADDYITKPFGVLELTSRINAHLRKSNVKMIYQKENLIINKETYTCSIDDTIIYLTTKEFELLFLLLQNEGKVVEKARILNEIWQMDASIETRTLDMHIKSLRQKIKDANFEIKTIRGVGYTL